MECTLEDLASAQDLDLGHSDWFPVEQDRIHAFAEATEDRQWIHTDPERARASRFGGTVAHGYLVLSLIPRLFHEVFRVDGIGMIINYGLEKVRFIQPVPAGDAVRLEATVLRATPKGDNLLVRIQCDLILQSSQRRAVVAETIFLVVPKTDPEPETGTT